MASDLRCGEGKTTELTQMQLLQRGRPPCTQRS